MRIRKNWCLFELAFVKLGVCMNEDLLRLVLFELAFVKNDVFELTFAKIGVCLN
jgi:hypothetical protein